MSDNKTEPVQFPDDWSPEDVKKALEGVKTSVDFQEHHVILGRYKVQRTVGRGGMGVVYLCHDEVGDIQVAVKTLPAELAKISFDLDMIRDNFRLVERLHHPNIAGIKTLERDPETGDCYLILEYVDGVSLLKHRLHSGGRLVPEEAIPLLRQVAEALDFGHGERVVHRDVKPENIMITADGKVKVLDYGLAWRIQESIARLSNIAIPISGTGPYMSPEQWKGQEQDGHSDQYSLAVVAYELLSGRPPFEGSNLDVLRNIVLNEEPEKPKDLDAGIWTVLKKALSKKKDERYRSCAAFVEDLSRATAGGRIPRIRSGGRIAAVAGVAAIAVAAVFVSIKLGWSGGAREEPVVTATSPDGQVAHDPLNYHALVIGISEYNMGNADHWDNLPNAKGDANAIGNVLEQEYGFEVTKLLDKKATKEAIIENLDRLGRISERDAVLIYFAGHGYYENHLREGYWIPSGAERPEGGKVPRDGWVWNSIINKIVGASVARHVLIIADSCYSGSLLRGGTELPEDRQYEWYRQAIRKPSRYVITSGDNEPVLDGSAGHSVFAQQILNFLKYSEKGIFSANELGIAIRERVSEVTGQMPRTERLAVGGDANGEFVFVRNDNLQRFASLRAEEPDPSPSVFDVVRSDARNVIPDDALQEALLAANVGATNTAMRILHSISDDNSDSELVEQLVSYVQGKQHREKSQNISNLIDRIQEMRESDEDEENPYANYARPRVLACIGPEYQGGNPDARGFTEMMRFRVGLELNRRDDIVFIERGNLDLILEEQGISAAGLTDRQAGDELGKLLPASMLLTGEYMEMGDDRELVLQVIDTSTSETRYLDIGSNPEQDVPGIYGRIAEKAVQAARELSPFRALVNNPDSPEPTIGVGEFHAVTTDARFKLIWEKPVNGDPANGQIPERIGSATISSKGDIVSVIAPQWTSEPPPESLNQIWAVEIEP